MRLRFLASLVALIVLASPSLVMVCEVVCAAEADAALPQEHACHGVTSQPLPNGPHLKSVIHACGHGEALPELSRVLDAPAVAPAPPVATLDLPPRPFKTLPSLRAAVPPDRHARITPLRI